MKVSVRNGDAGRASIKGSPVFVNISTLLQRFALGRPFQPYLTATGSVTLGLETITVFPLIVACAGIKIWSDPQIVNPVSSSAISKAPSGSPVRAINSFPIKSKVKIGIHLDTGINRLGIKIKEISKLNLKKTVISI